MDMTTTEARFADMDSKSRAKHFGRKVYREFTPITLFANRLRAIELGHGSSLDGKVSLFYGDDGVGKTVACEYYMREYAKARSGSFSGTDARFGEADSISDALWVSVADGNREVRPVVKIDVSPRVASNGLLADAFIGMTGTSPPRGARYPELLRTIKRQLHMQKTNILIFDNAHFCVERAIADGKANAGDIFAHFAEKCGVEIVLLGTSVARDLFNMSKALKTHKRFEIAVKGMPVPTGKSREFAAVLEKFEAWLPFDGNSDITSDDALTRLYNYCAGNMGVLSSFLNVVVQEAILDERPHIDLLFIEHAFDVIHGDPPKNPFRIGEDIGVQA